MNLLDCLSFTHTRGAKFSGDAVAPPLVCSNIGNMSRHEPQSVAAETRANVPVQKVSTV
ncbi:hypothetical protein WN55_04259 [Dufourea novaeangliae]|uniref:Uncharacterized protein n=1 Tax=Dufourea novaeangliae TaxID=178035 RepID=A0A154NXW4_DUFNO|nr:hypothetical protein WN55_04259 [Dufourea novaeangliae]